MRYVEPLQPHVPTDGLVLPGDVGVRTSVVALALRVPPSTDSTAHILHVDR